MPAMSDAPLRGYGGHEWFWEPGDKRLIYPLDKLMTMYDHSVGHNSTLILGVTPDTRGLIPEADVQRLREFGWEIGNTLSYPLAKTSGIGHRFELKLNNGACFDTVIIQEDIQYGERVRQYNMDVYKDGQWQSLVDGTCIGHKRIHRVPPKQVEVVRLTLEQAAGIPMIKQLAVFLSEGKE
jgi:alpha-L-fucosidase